MKIAFDYQIFTAQKYGGISRYFVNLADGLNKLEGVEVDVVAPLYVNEYLKKSKPFIVHGWPINHYPKTFWLRQLVCKAVSTPIFARIRPDILHETYYAPRGIPGCKGRRVVTVYDMTHERFANLFPSSDQSARLKKIAVDRADFVICISNKTRTDLLEFYDLPEEKVATVHLGYDLASSSNSQAHTVGDSRFPVSYLLFVGSRLIYKNFERFLQAFHSSSSLANNFKIVCFGGGGANIHELRLISQLGLTGKVLFVAGDDSLLAVAYQNAAGFVFPSLYEGFGIPPLEAMSFGCPVVCSNTSSIPEVVGDAGEYFDPNSVESMAQAIVSVVGSPVRSAELVRLGRERCRLFSWEKCASETLAIYRSLL